MKDKDPGPITVWVIEDNEEYRRTLRDLINGDEGTTCGEDFDNCEDALDALREESPPQVMLMDIGLPGMSGIEGVPLIKSISPATEVIMLTIYEDDNEIFRSICAGASGYLVKRSAGDQIAKAIVEAHRGGAPMSAQFARKVLNIFSSKFHPPQEYDLTAREKEILNLLVSGLSQKMIAARLFISPFTISTHMKNIYSKLQVHSKSEAVAKALRENLV